MLSKCRSCTLPTAAPVVLGGSTYCQECAAIYEVAAGTAPDMVNHPPHYRGPQITIRRGGALSYEAIYHDLECIEVIRHIRDIRLANAMKYVWRVAFGGKANDREDIAKACWHLQDWLDNPIEGQ